MSTQIRNLSTRFRTRRLDSREEVTVVESRRARPAWILIPRRRSLSALVPASTHLGERALPGHSADV